VTRIAMRGALYAAAFAASCVGVARAANEPAQEPGVSKDLTAVIALMGLPCGQVVKVVNKGDNDNLATCKDGHRYRVYVNADGRVVADKQ
jgi:hypothetical protein